MKSGKILCDVSFGFTGTNQKSESKPKNFCQAKRNYVIVENPRNNHSFFFSFLYVFVTFGWSICFSLLKMSSSLCILNQLSASFNGEYSYTGTYNNFPYYKKETYDCTSSITKGSYIKYNSDDNYWYISS